MAKTAFKPLRIRKLADRSEGERVTRYHPETGRAYLADPATWDPDDKDTWVDSPWPLAGLQIEGDPPKTTRIPTSFVVRGQAEGWLELENLRMEHAPGGPAEDPWRVTHTFTHADTVIIHTVDGDVRYSVVRQPNKYDGGPDPGTGKPTRDAGNPDTSVDWFYEVKLES